MVNEICSSLCRSSITQRRFEFLSSSLHFDDKITQTERKKCYNFAPICDIWNTFVDNCKSNFTQYEYCTIDKQLLGFGEIVAFECTFHPNKTNMG